MTELLPTQEIESIRAQFQELGHVGIASSFDPNFVELARKQADTLVKRQRYYGVNNSKMYTINRFDRKALPDFTELVDTVHSRVTELGGSVWPETPNLIEHHEMEQGALGMPHYDSWRLVGKVAMINLLGSSRFLILEDNKPDVVLDEYFVEEGGMIVLDTESKHFHQGIAVDKRVNLTMSYVK